MANTFGCYSSHDGGRESARETEGLYYFLPLTQMFDEVLIYIISRH